MKTALSKTVSIDHKKDWFQGSSIWGRWLGYYKRILQSQLDKQYHSHQNWRSGWFYKDIGNMVTHFLQAQSATATEYTNSSAEG